MTQKKKIAYSLKNILENPIMKVILDRSSNIETVLEKVDSWWGYDLLSRKPGPAYIDENFVGTDLDLSCFLYELSNRNAVINIPTYKNIRPTKLKDGQILVSKDNRHGQILGLTANKDVFLFSLRIKDMNIINTSRIGEYRNFSITDLDGNFYEGWGNLQFIPTVKENKFIFENELISNNNNITFTNFVHPNRWSSLFGQYYFITKALINRLKEESSYYNREVKTMLEEGIHYPPKEDTSDWPESTKIPGKKIKVKSFEVELDIPDNNSVYPTYEHNLKNLVLLTNKRKYFTFKVVPNLNFAVRTVEFAYYKYGKNRIPHWLVNVNWEENYIVPGKRNKWDRIILFQNQVGQPGISIKKRIYETSQEVSLDYDDGKEKIKNDINIVFDKSENIPVQNETSGVSNQEVVIIKQNTFNIETW